MRVADVGDEEFPKAPLHALAGRDKGRGGLGDNGDELVHELPASPLGVSFS